MEVVIPVSHENITYNHILRKFMKGKNLLIVIFVTRLFLGPQIGIGILQVQLKRGNAQ